MMRTIFLIFVVCAMVFGQNDSKNYGCTLEYRQTHDYKDESRCKKAFDNMYQEEYPLARIEFYCGNEFDSGMRIVPFSRGFNVDEHFQYLEKRKIKTKLTKSDSKFSRISREHVVPRSKLLKSECTTDFHNLYPALEIINNVRGTLDFDESYESPNGRTWGKRCESTFEAEPGQFYGHRITSVFRPRDAIKGIIGRTFLYMESNGCYQMTGNQREKYVAWDEKYPVTKEECEKEKKVFEYQGAHNAITQKKCIERFGSIYQ